MRIQLFILIFLGFNSTLFSQNSQRSSDKLAITSNRRDMSFGIRMYSQGYGAFANFGKQLNLTKQKFYEIELTEIRHPKQTKSSSDISTSSFPPAKSYFYGKQNTFITLRGGMGYKKIIGEKAEKSGVEVAWSYFAGASIGLLKPYYLKVLVVESPNGFVTLNEIKYSEENEKLFLNQNTIYGASGFLKGFGGMKFMPGFHGKIAMHFDWSRDETSIKEIQIGFSLDAYFSKVPIMVIENNRQFFPQFFAGITIGRKR